MPWTCTLCSVENDNHISICKTCDTPNENNAWQLQYTSYLEDMKQVDNHNAAVPTATAVVATAATTSENHKVGENKTSVGDSWIYTLQCKSKNQEEMKYYVGKSTAPIYRVENHVTGDGSSWTSKYKPISVIDVRPCQSPADEDTRTIDLMREHGIDNVRGGSFVRVDLPDYQRLTLEQMIRSHNNTCFNCGQPGHFAADCKIEATCSNNSNNQKKKKKKKKKTTRKKKQKKYACFHCGAEGHFAPNCPEKEKPLATSTQQRKRRPATTTRQPKTVSKRNKH